MYLTFAKRGTAPLLTLLALMTLLPVDASFADPPPWAPAHGWRKKHDPHYVGYEGRRWPSDYGVMRGGCDLQAIGAVLGGAVGVTIGSRVGERDERAVATVIGAVLGAVIGAQVGRSMDEEDRACVGHALELVDDGRPVYWENAYTGAQYTVTPGRALNGDRICREFLLDVDVKGRRDRSQHVACRSGNGRWSIVRR
jgi:surface antigen